MPQIKEAGDYASKVITSEFGQSNSGTPFFTMEHVNDDGDTIRSWLYLSDEALPYTIKTLRDAFNFDGNFETLCDQVNQKDCRIVVKIEEYEGKERAKVQFINNINGGYKAKTLEGGNSFLKALSEKAKRIPVPAAKTTTTAKPAAKKDPF
jgi:hypothetical protein